MVTYRIILGRTAQKNGMYPLRIRFTMNRKHIEHKLGLYTYKEDFKDEKFLRKVRNSSKLNKFLNGCKVKADDAIQELISKNKPFTLEDVIRVYTGVNETTTILDFFEEIIQEKINAKKIGTAKTYRDTKNSLFKYLSPNTIFSQLGVAELQKYENYLRSNGLTNGGIAFKMRMIRTLFNLAIQRKLVDKKFYPFDEYKISKLKASSNHIALTKEELIAFKNVNLQNHPNLVLSHKIFMFSFYTRGMNFKDIMILKKSQLKENTLSYKRSKTGIEFHISLPEEVTNIVSELNSSNNDSEYLFPIIKQINPSAQYLDNKKRKHLKKYNADLKEIGKIAGITSTITSYVARHTYATLLKLEGASTDLISESLGHSSVLVTKAYLKSFGSSKLDEVNNQIFKNLKEENYESRKKSF